MSPWSWLSRHPREALSRKEEAIRSGCSRCGSRRPLAWQRNLRIGQLHACPRCGALWYLWEDWPNTGLVEPEDIPLIEAWDRRSVTLAADMQTMLRSIGASPTHPTPANTETPCAVTTHSGERLPCAIVRQQDYAPFGGHAKGWRLASEIAAVEPSPHALPIEVREGTANAPDVYKNVFHVEFVMPDGCVFASDGLENFMVNADYRPADARMRDREEWDRSGPTGVLLRPEAVVCFVADNFDPLYRPPRL